MVEIGAAQSYQDQGCLKWASFLAISGNVQIGENCKGWQRLRLARSRVPARMCGPGAAWPSAAESCGGEQEGPKS
jgi:hypothetical protein